MVNLEDHLVDVTHINVNGNPAGVIDVLIKEGIDARMQARIQDAEDHYRTAYSLAVKHRFSLGQQSHAFESYQSDFCTNMGDLRRIETRIEEAVDFFDKAIEVIKYKNTPETNQKKAKALEFRSLVHTQHTHNYDQAVSDSREALKLYTELENQPKIARLRSMYAVALSLADPVNNYAEADIQCFQAINYLILSIQSSMDSGVKKQEFHNLGDAYHSSGRVNSMRGNPLRAISDYRSALNSFRFAGENSIGSSAIVHARMAQEYAHVPESQDMVAHHLEEYEKIRNQNPCPIQKIVLQEIEPMIESLKHCQ
ncbi:MAG: hypothetical protein KKE20_04335 [Nanoarchaeota archaeon]|nr:hypothetical protein [Nanoarchaeota archaeon]